jgi:hypothetical protein
MEQIPDWKSSHPDITIDNANGMNMFKTSIESPVFDFSFLNDDDDDDEHKKHRETPDASSKKEIISAEDHEVTVIASSYCTGTADDLTSASTSSCGCTGTTSMGSTEQSHFTEPSEDDTTIPLHSPNCRCMQLSPFSVSSSSPIFSSTYEMNHEAMPSTIVVESGDPYNHSNVVPLPSSTPLPPTLLHLRASSDDDASWCKEAAKRVMTSVEVYGKLLMRLRDYQQQQQQPQSKSSHRRFHKPYQANFKKNTSVSAPKGCMTHQQIIQQVPKLQRILVKTLTRCMEKQGMEQGIPTVDRKSLEQSLRSSMITPLHIMNVLQHVNGVQITPCHNNSNNYYYSIDMTWLSQLLDPKLGYNPWSGNIVLQLVEQRLLHLLDQCPKEKTNCGGRYCTNEISHIYELTFHEPLLYKPLGYNTFKDLIQAIPSLERVYDNDNCGPNGIRWFIQRVSPVQMN